MNINTTCERLAAYTAQATWEKISPEARGKLRQHVLDTLGCALGATPAATSSQIAFDADEGGHALPCSLAGGGTATPERSAFFNTALIGTLEAADSFLAPGEFCQPADNLGGILAAAELADASGKQFLTALAIGYHVQCRLASCGVGFSAQGYDGTLPLAVSLACGMGYVLGLTERQIAHAIALCAAGGLTLRGPEANSSASDAEGALPSGRLAAALCAFRCMQNVRLAQRGVAGPLGIFDGPGGLEGILGKPFGIEWEAEDLDGILACSIKKYTAAFYAQSAIEAVLELRREHAIEPKQVHGIQVDIFQTAYEALSGGSSLTPGPVNSKRDAEQSLAYLAAAALMDGEFSPAQLTPARVQSDDVQQLLKRVTIWLSTAYTREYPNSLKCKVRIGLKDGNIFELEKSDYPGFFRRPMPVEQLLEKFKGLTAHSAPAAKLQLVIQAVAKLDGRPVRELGLALREVGAGDSRQLVESRRVESRPVETRPVETLACA